MAGSFVPSGRAQGRSSEDGPPAVTIPFPLEDVKAGLMGTAYTVFEGVRPEAMSVEILGRLRNALGPGRDLILARLRGSKPEYTGVVAGMSGSPVYVDGKLLGALSYRIGQFSKEPIAGITPLAQMLEVGGAARSSGMTTGHVAVEGLEIRPIDSPLVFSGFSEETVARFGEPFKTMGLLPVSGLGAMDAAQRQSAPLEPGSAVSAVLVDGDLSVTGTCTVSYLDATRLLACGHPLTQSGAIDLPMAKAEVLATLASPLNSFKIVNATEVVGAFQEDRSSAISGRVGAVAHMIPVTVELSGQDASAVTHTLHFAVASHRELTPQLMMAALYQSLQQVRSGSTEASYKVSGEISFAGESAGKARLPPVRLEGWEAQSGFNPGSVNAALALGAEISQLFSNSEEQPVLAAVRLRVESSDRRRAATLEEARVSESDVRAGEAIEVETMLRPYQRAEQVLKTRVTLPLTLEPGPLRLLVSDGATVDRLLEPVMARPVGVADTVTRLNAAHANDRVYVTLLDHAAQAVLDAAPLSGLPLSMANVLEPLKGSQRLRLSGESVTELGSASAEDAVTGYQVISLMVR